jgi:hypothetical protein
MKAEGKRMKAEVLRQAQDDRQGMDGTLKQFTAVRDETAVLTEEIEKVEKEIDARVTALYGL